MMPAIHCPSCTRPLGRVNSEGISQVACNTCQQSFGVIYGKLTGWVSWWEAMLYLTSTLPSIYKRRYEFRVATPGRDLRVLKFSMPGQSDRVPVRPGDRISILYSLSGNGMRKLIAIYNHTIGKQYRLPSPIPTAAYLLATQGSIATLALVGILATGWGSPWMLGAGAIALLAYTRLVNVAELTNPPLLGDIAVEARLLEERRLMQQKAQLEQRVEVIRQERHSHIDLIQRLQALRSKILGFNPALYATRVASIESAIRLLKQRIQHDQLLVEQYHQTVQMIDIELEATYLADQLPELNDFTGTILSRLEELRAIEEQNNNLRFQLEANEEVRRLGLAS